MGELTFSALALLANERPHGDSRMAARIQHKGQMVVVLLASLPLSCALLPCDSHLL